MRVVRVKRLHKDEESVTLDWIRRRGKGVKEVHCWGSDKDVRAGLEWGGPWEQVGNGEKKSWEQERGKV